MWITDFLGKNDSSSLIFKTDFGRFYVFYFFFSEQFLSFDDGIQN